MSPMLIVVVDDEFLIRWSLAQNLVRAGYEVIQAADGEQAVKLLAEHADRLRVVITDLRLPGIDGLEVQRRAREICPGCAVIFISAHGSDEAREQAAKDGAFRFVDKPFKQEDMLKLVESAVANSR